MDTGRYTAAGQRAEAAYGELKHRLLLGEFALGRRLGEERLAGELGVSRTPVREALHRLHAEGLVRRSPEGSFEPVAPDVERIRHLYEVRAGLELHALQRPARAGTTHDLAALEALRDEWSALADDAVEADAGFVLVDESFHVALAESAGNPELVELLRLVNDRIRIVRMQDFLTAERISETVAEHLALLSSVVDGDLVGAERLFTEHVARSFEVVEERVGRAVARMLRAEP